VIPTDNFIHNVLLNILNEMFLNTKNNGDHKNPKKLLSVRQKIHVQKDELLLIQRYSHQPFCRARHTFQFLRNMRHKKHRESYENEEKTTKRDIK